MRAQCMGFLPQSPAAGWPGFAPMVRRRAAKGNRPCAPRNALLRPALLAAPLGPPWAPSSTPCAAATGSPASACGSGRWRCWRRPRSGSVFLVVTSDGLNDYQGRPLGTDFSNVYAAGTYVLDGHAAAPFDWPAQHAREQAIFGEKTPFYGWHYPPFFLFVAGLLALMPYALALAVWQGVTLALYLGTIWIILRSVSADAGAAPIC